MLKFVYSQRSTRLLLPRIYLPYSRPEPQTPAQGFSSPCRVYETPFFTCHIFSIIQDYRVLVISTHKLLYFIEKKKKKKKKKINNNFMNNDGEINNFFLLNPNKINE